MEATLVKNGNRLVRNSVDVIATLLTYRWKKQMILSMAAGTILYMVLVQLVFV